MVEVKEFDQYVVMVDGSRRVTLRNRRYLRQYTPFQCKPFSANPVPAYVPPVNSDATQVGGTGAPGAGDAGTAGQAVGRGGPAPQDITPGLVTANTTVGDGHVPPQPTYAQVVAAPSRAIVPPVQREGPAPAPHRVLGPDMESGDGQAATQPGQASGQEMNVGVGKNVTPVRRSSRANRGQTKKFEDYELGSFRNR